MKNLIGIDYSQNKSIKQYGFELRQPIICNPRTSLLILLREFKKGKSHLALITEQVTQMEKRQSGFEGKSNSTTSNSDKKQDIMILGNNYLLIVKGIVTLEDVLEKMINIDIKDEDDYDDENKVKDPIQKKKSRQMLNSKIL